MDSKFLDFWVPRFPKSGLGWAGLGLVPGNPRGLGGPSGGSSGGPWALGRKEAKYLRRGWEARLSPLEDYKQTIPSERQLKTQGEAGKQG